MAKEKNIIVNDFNLFCDVMKSAVKIVDSAKLTIDENGLAIYGARKPIARCELNTNAITSNEKIEFSILDLQMFVKILQTTKDIHENDYSDLKFSLENEKVSLKSKKFKTKFQTQVESKIEQWISTKIQTKLEPVFEFTTTTDLIKRARNHQFIFSDPSTMRIYLETKNDMENNVLYATLGNKQTALDNEMTFKFGLVTFGSLKDRSMIIDIDRLNLFDAVQTSEIKISLMNANVIVCDSKITGKNDTYFNSKLYVSPLKA